MKTYFINEAFEKAVTDYLNSKDKKEGLIYNSFLVNIYLSMKTDQKLFKQTITIYNI